MGPGTGAAFLYDRATGRAPDFASHSAENPPNHAGAGGSGPVAASLLPTNQTFPIHLRSAQTALSEVRLRRSKILRATAPSRPFLRLFQASLALMATNCSTLGSR